MLITLHTSYELFRTQYTTIWCVILPSTIQTAVHASVNAKSALNLDLAMRGRAIGVPFSLASTG